MPRSGLEAFSALWRAYGEGRLGRSLDLVDKDCEITFADGSTTLHGHDGVREWLNAARRDWKTLTIVYDEVHEERPGCVVGACGLTASSADGAELDCAIAFVAEFAGGRLVRGRMFRDRDEAVQYLRAAR